MPKDRKKTRERAKRAAEGAANISHARRSGVTQGNVSRAAGFLRRMGLIGDRRPASRRNDKRD